MAFKIFSKEKSIEAQNIQLVQIARTAIVMSENWEKLNGTGKENQYWETEAKYLQITFIILSEYDDLNMY